jgi:RNA 3'-terminal phosphate cyclase (ATP)
VGPHLADQLLLPLAIGAGGVFRTSEPTEHTATQIRTISRFLDARIVVREDGAKAWRVEVDPS